MKASPKRDSMKFAVLAFPNGATVVQICGATSFSSRSVCEAVSEMSKRGELFPIYRPNMTRYFLSAEAREAARPAVLAEWEKADEAAKERRRALANARRGVSGGLKRLPVGGDAILTLVREQPGLRLGDMVAVTGRNRHGLKRIVALLVERAELFAGGLRSHRRYFVTLDLAAEYDAANSPDAKIARHRERCRVRSRVAYEAEKAARPPRPPKPPQPPKAAKAAKPPREKKAAAPKLPKPVLRLAGSSVRVEQAPMRRGPAYMPGDVHDLPRSPGFKHTVYPRRPDPIRTNTHWQF